MELSAEAFDAQLTADAPPVVTEPAADLTSFDDEADVNDAKATDDAKAPVRDDKGKFAKAEAPVEEKPADKKPRNDPQARIDQAIARQREAERKAEAAEARARELEARATPQPKAEPVGAPASEKFPSFAQYAEAHPDATLEDYMDARDDHRESVRAKKAAEQQETASLETAFSAKAKTFSERFGKATEADAELVKRINPRLLQVRPYSHLTAADKDAIRAIPNPVDRDRVAFECFLADQWIDSEHAPKLLEHLSDPAEFQRLATLPPALVVRELAKLEAGFSAASDKESSGPALETTPPSKAHAPIKPLGSAPRVPEDDGSDDEPVEKFISRENAKDRKAGRL